LRSRLVAASLVLALAAGCSGGSSGANVPGGGQVAEATHQGVTPDAGSNIVANPGFETGSLSSWTSCGSLNDTSVSTAQAHSGTYSALIGTTAKPEINGTAGLCQTVTVPASATLTFWVYEGTTDTISYKKPTS
jgi:hypothetical protein